MVHPNQSRQHIRLYNGNNESTIIVILNNRNLPAMVDGFISIITTAVLLQ